MILTGFHTLFAALGRAGFFTPPFWLARYRSEMTTFFKRFPATKQNRPQWANFRIVCTVGYYLNWKKKFAGLGGVKGGSHEYILQSHHKKFLLYQIPTCRLGPGSFFIILIYHVLECSHLDPLLRTLLYPESLRLEVASSFIINYQLHSLLEKFPH